MKRVLQVSTLPITTRLFILPLATSLTEMGYQVELACGGITAYSFDPFVSHPIALSRSPFSLSNGRGLVQLRRLMQHNQYDVVHLHTPVAGLVGRLAAQLSRVPIVLYTLHGSFWDTHPCWRAILFDGLERLAGQWTSHVFALNAQDASDLITRCGLKPAQVTQLPVGGAGVDLTWFNPAQFSQADIIAQRAALGLAADDMVIGYVGRIDRDKGIGEMLKSCAQLRDQYPRLRLLLIGSRLLGDRDAAINTQLAELGDMVIYSGFRDDVPALLACMDVIVSASRRDGFGMLLAEAAAMGKPVVATATRGTSAAVIDGVTGLVVPIGDVAALSQAIATLITDESLRCKLGQGAWQRAQERFARDKLLRLYQDKYHELLT